MTVSVLCCACVVPIVLFGMACTAASAKVDMSDGFDVTNPEHVDVVVPRIVAAFEPESERIEFCVAVTRIIYTHTGTDDIFLWSAADYMSRVWEAELKNAVDQGDAALSDIYTTKRRADWPERLLLIDREEDFGAQSKTCGSDLAEVFESLDLSEFE